MKRIKDDIAANKTVTLDMESIRPYRVSETLIPNLAKLAENQKNLNQRIQNLTRIQPTVRQ